MVGLDGSHGLGPSSRVWAGLLGLMGWFCVCKSPNLMERKTVILAEISQAPVLTKHYNPIHKIEGCEIMNRVIPFSWTAMAVSLRKN